MSNQEPKFSKSAYLKFAIVLLSCPAISQPQSLVATVPVGTNPLAIALNQATNRIYVANCPTTANSLPGVNGTVTVIDGETNTTTTVPAGICPVSIAVNPVTNKIYVANLGKFCLISNSCNNEGSVTVIDGATNSATQLEIPSLNLLHPRSVAVNTITNRIYVTNHFSSDAAVIDGSTNAVTMIPTAGLPYDIAANPATNKIYVSSFDAIAVGTQTTVTEIDGASNATVSIVDPKAADPIAVAVNPATNKIYVANLGNLGKNGTDVGSITVIDGATNETTNLVDANAIAPHAVAINSLTNRIYIANTNNAAQTGNGGITVIDGATNSVTTVSDPNARTSCDPFSTQTIAVNVAANQIYVANCGSNNISVIDGATNTVLSLTDASALTPVAIAINSGTNKIYVANSNSNNVSVFKGDSGALGFALSVTKTGSGTGTLTSAPSGINCGGACSQSFASGTVVAVAAVPSANSIFVGWSGACAGTDPHACNVTLDFDQIVTATFNAAPDFTISPSATNLGVKRGGQANETLTFPVQGGFSGTITLSCSVSGPSPMPTCGLMPTTVKPGDTATLTVSATAVSAALIPRILMRTTGLYAAWSPLGIMACILSIGFDKKRRRLWLLCLLTVAAGILPAGCGGGSGPPPPQTYTVTVTAASSTIEHATSINVTVN
jgi:YVTN family beta-propeller protein